MKIYIFTRPKYACRMWQNRDNRLHCSYRKSDIIMYCDIMFAYVSDEVYNYNILY